jgi:hypothetical protein
MKKKIRCIDPNGKLLEDEINVRDREHLQAQLKYRSNVFVNKKKKEPKYKHKETEY